MEAGYTQKRMEEIQRNGDFASAFSKMVSGKAGYKAVIEKKAIIIKCRKCNKVLDEGIKFCPDCGTKVWVKPTKCPKCTKGVFDDEKFCKECGETLEAPPL